MTRIVLVMLAVASPLAAQDLQVEMVGNAGVRLSDGSTSLLVDLPYESGAFGYMTYDVSALDPSGDVVAVITHHHRDHFDPGEFEGRDGWQVIGPPSAVGDLPERRVISGDRVEIGAFTVTAIPTPHTPDHRSYEIEWRGRVFYFVGDTEAPETIPADPRADILFITPWLSCRLADSGRDAFGVRAIAYHLNPDGSDRICGPVEVLPQGTSFEASPAAVEPRASSSTLGGPH